MPNAPFSASTREDDAVLCEESAAALLATAWPQGADRFRRLASLSRGAMAVEKALGDWEPLHYPLCDTNRTIDGEYEGLCDCGLGALLDALHAMLAGPDATVPHSDTCPLCNDGVFAYAAEREKPEGHEGYNAWYHCRVGHSWQTYWSNRYRLTPHELAIILRGQENRGVH